MEDTGRPQEEAGGHHQQKPAAIINYNKHKAGVDRHHQMSSYYPLARKTVKWCKQLFFQLLTMAVVNSHKYMDIHNKTRTRLENFINQLAKELSAVTHVDPPPAPTASLEVRKFKPGPHFPTHIPATAKKARPQAPCVLCKTVKINGTAMRRESTWQCATCLVPLCVSCFWPYHCPNSTLARLVDTCPQV